MMTEHVTVTLTDDDVGQRLDKALSVRLDQFSRARLQSLLQEGMVSDSTGTVFDNPAQKLKQPVTLTITIPEAIEAEPVAEDIPLDIVFEDEHLLVINKPAGMVVHPAAGNYSGTLVNALLYHCGDRLSGIGGVKRPGIVHRLDKETSGLMVVAKSDQAHNGLAAQFADRSLSRQYTALIWGAISPREGQIDAAIGRHPHDRKKMTVVDTGGKHAVTHYETIERFGLAASLIECRLETGRTHQIRVHMTSVGHPLLGDATYGETRQSRRLRQSLPEEIRSKIPTERQALHAWKIKFIHPLTKETYEYTSALPDDLSLLIDALRTI